MISEQLDVFPGHERFVSALLGLLSRGATIVDALELERQDGGSCPDGPLLDVALGIVSWARTLRAALGAVDEPKEGATPEQESVAANDGGGVATEAGSWLR